MGTDPTFDDIFFKVNDARIPAQHKEKFLDNSKNLTSLHLIIFCAQQFLSTEQIMRENQMSQIISCFNKKLPDYFIKNEIRLDLITKLQFSEEHKSKIKSEEEKMLFRNKYEINGNSAMTIKNLLNSYFNLIDRGIDTKYFESYRVMVQQINSHLKKKLENIEENISSKDYTERGYTSLHSYLRPVFVNCSPDLLMIYMSKFRLISEKYMSHYIELKTDFQGMEDDVFLKAKEFNRMVIMKKNLIQNLMKINIICIGEDNLDYLIEKLLESINTLKTKLDHYYDKVRKEAKEIFQKEKEEKRMKENQKFKRNVDIKEKSRDKGKDKADEIQEDESGENLPSIEKFLESIHIYYGPAKTHEESDCLYDFLRRNDEVYNRLFTGKFLPGDFDAYNDETKDDDLKKKRNTMFDYLYPQEAKCHFQLNCFMAEATYKEESKNPDSENSPNKLHRTCYFHTNVIIHEKPKNGDQSSNKDIYIVNLNSFESAKRYPHNFITNENTNYLTYYTIKGGIEGGDMPKDYSRDPKEYKDAKETSIEGDIINFQACCEECKIGDHFEQNFNFEEFDYEIKFGGREGNPISTKINENTKAYIIEKMEIKRVSFPGDHKDEKIPLKLNIATFTEF